MGVGMVGMVGMGISGVGLGVGDVGDIGNTSTTSSSGPTSRFGTGYGSAFDPSFSISPAFATSKGVSVFDVMYDIEVIAGDDYVGVDDHDSSPGVVGVGGGPVGSEVGSILSSDYPTDSTTDDLSPLGDIHSMSASGFAGTPLSATDASTANAHANANANADVNTNMNVSVSVNVGTGAGAHATPPKLPAANLAIDDNLAIDGSESAMALGGVSEVKVSAWEEKLEYDTMSGSESEDDDL